MARWKRNIWKNMMLMLNRTLRRRERERLRAVSLSVVGMWDWHSSNSGVKISSFFFPRLYKTLSSQLKNVQGCSSMLAMSGRRVLKYWFFEMCRMLRDIGIQLLDWLGFEWAIYLPRISTGWWFEHFVFLPNLSFKWMFGVAGKGWWL